jgi:hypothetical protein
MIKAYIKKVTAAGYNGAKIVDDLYKLKAKYE